MSCDCIQFLPIELNRKSITRRIKESPEIRKRLELIAEHAGLRLYLFRCAACGQFWQTGHEWNFADREYLFHVPPTEIEDWQREPYQQPAAMMIFSAVMTDFFALNTFETGTSACRSLGCEEMAIRFSVLCLTHHIESLRNLRQLPQPPLGRMFPPYYDSGQTMN